MTAAARKYAAVYGLAVRQQLERRGELVGRCVFYGVLLLVFAGLWKTVHAMGALADVSPASFLWYVAITEWIVLSVPLAHRTVEVDVQSGDVAYHLTRPVSYLGMRVVEALAQTTVRLAVLAVVGFAIAYLLIGGLPPEPLALLAALPLGVAGAFTIALWFVGVGCAAFWIQDASAVHWVIQKLLFVLGGLILPLSIYPDWLREAAERLPFAAVLYGPGRLAFGLEAGAPLAGARDVLGWSLASVVVLVVVFGQARRRLEVNGG